MELTNIDLFYFLEELKVMEGSRIENFYLNENKFFLKFYSNKTKKSFFVKNKSLIYLSDKKEETNIPSPFIMALRKLKNAVIQEIKQIENERILKFVLTKKDDKNNIKKYYLYVELFLFSNIFLCDENNIIINIFLRKFSKDRVLKIKQEYKFPSNLEVGFSNFSSEKFLKCFEKSDENIEKFLSKDCSFTNKYSKLSLLKSNIGSGLKYDDLKKDIGKIKDLEKTIKELKKIDIKPNILKNSFYPFKFSENTGETFFNSINDCIIFLDSQNIKKDSKEDNYIKETEKLLKRVKIQEKQKNDIEIEIEKLNNQGNKIYENYEFIENLLKNVNDYSKKKGWKELKNKIQNDEKLKKIILKIDEKNNLIEIDL